MLIDGLCLRSTLSITLGQMMAESESASLSQQMTLPDFRTPERFGCASRFLSAYTLPPRTQWCKSRLRPVATVYGYDYCDSLVKKSKTTRAISLARFSSGLLMLNRKRAV